MTFKEWWNNWNGNIYEISEDDFQHCWEDAQDALRQELAGKDSDNA